MPIVQSISYKNPVKIIVQNNLDKDYVYNIGNGSPVYTVSAQLYNDSDRAQIENWLTSFTIINFSTTTEIFAGLITNAQFDMKVAQPFYDCQLTVQGGVLWTSAGLGPASSHFTVSFTLTDVSNYKLSLSFIQLSTKNYPCTSISKQRQVNGALITLPGGQTDIYQPVAYSAPVWSLSITTGSSQDLLGLQALYRQSTALAFVDPVGNSHQVQITSFEPKEMAGLMNYWEISLNLTECSGF